MSGHVGLLVLLVPLFMFAAYVLYSSLWAQLKLKVPYVRSGLDGLAEVLARYGVSHKDEVWDLGSGDGKVLFYIEKLTGAKGVGFELAAWPYHKAQVRKILTGSKLTFHRADLFEQDVSKPTVLYLYLLPDVLERLTPRLLSMCRPGTLIIARDFPLPYTQPNAVAPAGKHRLYVYQLPYENLR